MNQYDQYIEDYKNSVDNVRGKCEVATIEMQGVFPELIRKRGHVEVLFIDRDLEHWWLETANGDIVDPTASQFSCILRYIELDETLPEPIGKCLNCGEYVYPGAPNNHACSSVCNMAVMESLGQVD